MPTPTGLSCAVTILRDHSPHAVGSFDGSCLAQVRSHAPPINPAGCFHTLVYLFCNAIPNQNSVTYVNWASDGEQLWDRAVYEMGEGKVITCVMGMLRQLLLRGRITLYGNMGSRLNAHQLHLAFPLGREGAHLEISINGFDILAKV